MRVQVGARALSDGVRLSLHGRIDLRIGADSPLPREGQAKLAYRYADEVIASSAPGLWYVPQSLFPAMKQQGTSIVRLHNGRHVHGDDLAVPNHDFAVDDGGSGLLGSAE